MTVFVPTEIRTFLNQRDSKNCTIYKSGLGSQACLAQGILRQGRDVVVIVPDQGTLARLWSLLQCFAPSVEPLRDRQWVSFGPYQPAERSRLHWPERWASLFSLLTGPKHQGVILTLDNLLPFWPAPDVLDQESLLLFRGEERDPESLLQTAVSWGYSRVNLVTRPGEIALRGDILDIFTPGYSWPLRVEFFGELLENIRLFEPVSQRSKQDVEEAVLLPVAPAVLSSERVRRAKDSWTDLWKTGQISKAERSRLERLIEEGENDLPPGLFYPDAVPLQEWFRPDAVYLLAEADQLRTRLDEHEASWQSFMETLQTQNVFWPSKTIVQPASRARQAWLDQQQILFEDLPLGDRQGGISLPEKRYDTFPELFWKPEERKRPWSALMESLRRWRTIKKQTILCFRSLKGRSTFFKFLEKEDVRIQTEYNPDSSGIFALISDFDRGAELEWNHLLILSEDVFQPQRDARGRKAARTDFQGLQRFEDIERDALLVHRDYGVGRFLGLNRLTVGDVGNDYLELEYAEGDKLFVPVDRLNLIQKYKGPEGAVPSLDRLGSSRWANTKARVRKALQAIAHDLVEVYAYRKVAKGYAYGPPDELYREFEATFDFEETADQEQAIADVLADMDRPEPMDRLVCGDAGFGKTEVALRAAFRAVASGKQVAMLCPTTVLAEQHYQNFKRRMEDFSVNVAMVSRFVPQSKQKKVLERAEKGEVDILIGTHRLLSDDVRLPRLSLYILDEEQRFGVRHKEKLKRIRRNLDVLTLTATPIPRTLQLSLSGIRQLSVIETPPQERKPVETSLVERDPEMLQSIIKRELQREGQVFWVYNRVKGINRVKEFVSSLAPEARVAVAHGQMNERVLEETMHRFWRGEIDVLISTAIIESGLDFPRANSLVVDQAHMFGLGQLYQLRGRVGRSRDQAYAYFVVPSLDGLAAKARKRLQTILDLDYLGAGFQVALEDLRLRGAGNILGEAQSGNIGKVGLDLFLEMLEQEVSKVRGEPVRDESEPELNISFEANIPGDYIVDPKERLQYYKSLSGAESFERLAEWADEIRDRFGPLPSSLDRLIAVLELKRVLATLQVERADLQTNRVMLSWPDDSQPVDPNTFLVWLQARQDRAKFTPPSKLELRFDTKASISEAIREIGRELEGLKTGAALEGACSA